MFTLSPTIILLIIISLICITEACAISCVKKFHNGYGLNYFVMAVALYAIVCFLLNRSFYYKDSMGMTNVIWSGMSVLTVSLFGILIFQEKLHMHDMIAAGLITSGLLIVKYTD